MNVGIHYALDEHYWSTCWIRVDDVLLEISITHIYPENPIEECINALIGMIKGDPERKFVWYGEPGSEQVLIKETPSNKRKVYVKVENFVVDYGDPIENLETSIEFEIEKKQLVRMFYFEFKKISELMKDEQYAENRKGEFPSGRFITFEELALEFLEIN
ncbi:MAG: hypothetical protein R2792_04820 [Saprospiraceae bacterium]